jgi:hypothetical protein
LQAGAHSRNEAMREPRLMPVRFAHHLDSGCDAAKAASAEPQRARARKIASQLRPLLIF